MSFFDIIAIIGLTQAFVVSCLIFTNKVFRNEANRYFAYFLLIISVIGFDARLRNYYYTLGEFWADFFDIVGDDIPWVMIFYLPLFKFFQKISGKLELKFPFWILFIPFILFTVINLIIDLDLEFGLISSPFFTDNRIIFYQLEDYVSLPLFIALHLYVFFNLIRPGKEKWLSRLWWYCSVLIIIWIVLMIDQSFFDDIFFKVIENTLWSAIAVFIYWLMYSGLFQFNLVNNRQEIRDRLMGPVTMDTPKKTGLSSKSKAYFDQLMELMLVEKAYRNPDLGRELVAEHLGISVSYLTQLIKEYSEKNLAGFINEFRVEEVKKMLKDPSFDSFDHLSIGLEAGFKSKSAYYTAFKAQTGQTPSQFKNASS